MKANLNPLPVRLVDFTSQCDQGVARLHWSTASEENNEKFIIERSVDGLKFESAGEIAGNGNSKELINYTYEDLSSYDGTSYYRLKQVDYDGQYEYSKIIVNKCRGEAEIKIYPNPTEGEVRVTGLASGDRIKILTQMGHLVYSEVVKESSSNFSLGHLANGIYKITIENENLNYTSQLVINK
jgi:hypothetical protein